MLPAITNKTKITTKTKQGKDIESEGGVMAEVKKSFSEERRFELIFDEKRK